MISHKGMKTKLFPLRLVWPRAIWNFSSPHPSLDLPSLCSQWLLPCNLSVVCVCAWCVWAMPVPVSVPNKRLWSLFTKQNRKHSMERNTLLKSSTVFYEKNLYCCSQLTHKHSIQQTWSYSCKLLPIST